MLRKSIVCAILAVLLIFTFCSCKKEGEPFVKTDAEEKYTFVDSVGNSVTVDRCPKKTAILFSSFAQIWKLSGGEIAVTVAEAVERGFADDSAVLVDGGAGKTIDVEALIAAAPELVILSSDIAAQTETAQILRNASIPCAELRVECFEDYLKVLKIFSEINENSDAYVEYGENVEADIAELLGKIPESPTKTKVLFIRSGSGASSAKAKTAEDHFAAAMLKQLGAVNIADSAPVLLDGLSIEEIIKQNPDMIFISVMGDEQAAKAYMDSVLATDAWQSLRAVKEGRCYYLPKELFQFKPNSKWCEAYEYLAKLLYPEIVF